jgi:hypothetical protein
MKIKLDENLGPLNTGVVWREGLNALPLSEH